MNEPDFRHSIRIYWEDTDAGGVVFFANYLKFFERARTEWLRSRGIHQEALRHAQQVAFVVSETTVKYLKPAMLDDLLDIDVHVRSMRAASVHVDQQAWRRGSNGAELLSTSQIRLACVDTRTLQPRRLPIDIFQRLSP